MAARTKSKITPRFKTKYQVRNWPAYEAALRRRGDITFWFDENAINAWNAPAGGRPRWSTPLLRPRDRVCIDSPDRVSPPAPPDGGLRRRVDPPDGPGSRDAGPHHALAA
jgi:hypothetical protein